MPSLAQIIGTGMHDESPTKHAFRSDQLDELIGNGALGIALAVCFVVAEIADVADVVGGGAVFFGEGVDWIGLLDRGKRQ